MGSGSGFSGLTPKGAAGWLIAIGLAVFPLIAFPAYRWFYLIFLGISLVIGIVVASVLHLWHRFRPVGEGDVENNKRPLGLS